MDQIQEIKSRLDIVEVVKEYLPQMKQSGANWKGLCPFHNEKTPSFMVSQEKQIWHCFGCSEGGDIYEFVKKVENIEFPEALRMMAEKAGVVLKKQDPKLLDLKSRLLDLHKETTKFFMAHLWQTKAGKQAFEYLKTRGLKDEIIKEWKIGFAPESFDALTRHLQKQGFTAHEIKESGLIGITQKNKTYDRFRGRIMFPLLDAHGQIVAFTGRLLEDKEGQGKYVNSPQTLIYNKSYVVYGLYQAKDTIKTRGRAVFVEGQMDVITGHQQGFNNIVASSGTALTQTQLDLIKRYSSEIVFAFDADQAGDKAVIKATELALQKDLHVYIILMPEGQDPDSLIKQNPDKWRKLESDALELMDYFFQKAIDRGVDSLADKKQAAQFLLALIIKLPSPIDRDFYLQKLSSILSLSETALRESMSKIVNPASKTTGEAKRLVKEISSVQRMSQRLLGILLARSDLWQATVDAILPEMMTRPEQELYSQLVIYYTKNNSDWNIERLEVSEFKKLLDLGQDSDRLLGILSLLAEDVKNMEDRDIDNDWKLLVSNLKKNYIKQRINNLQANLKKVEVAGDNEQIKQLTAEISQLIAQSRS